MKKFLVLALMIGLVLVPRAALAQGTVEVFVDGNRVESDVPAVLVSSRTMLPFRAILNALGVGDEHIKWHSESKSIEVRHGSTYLFLVVGSPGLLVNDQLIILDSPPYIENDRTMVPVRFVSEALGAQVLWEDATKTVFITTAEDR